MDSDELQRIWKTQAFERQLTADYDALLDEVQRNKRTLDARVFWRDVLEVGTCILLAVFFLFWGIADHAWPCFVAALSAVWVGVFMVVDRIRHRRKASEFAEPLLACIESSLAQVDHQIWLLRNVFWWYLLPAVIGFVFVIGYYAWEIRLSWWLRVLATAVLLGFGALIFWIVYCVNQRALRRDLRPRQQELEALRHSVKSSED